MILYFTPRTTEDATKFNEVANQYFHAEWNAKDARFELEEEEDLVDELEEALTRINAENDIKGYFEIE